MREQETKLAVTHTIGSQMKTLATNVLHAFDSAHVLLIFDNDLCRDIYTRRQGFDAVRIDLFRASPAPTSPV